MNTTRRGFVGGLLSFFGAGGAGILMSPHRAICEASGSNNRKADCYEFFNLKEFAKHESRAIGEWTDKTPRVYVCGRSHSNVPWDETWRSIRRRDHYTISNTCEFTRMGVAFYRPDLPNATADERFTAVPESDDCETVHHIVKENEEGFSVEKPFAMLPEGDEIIEIRLVTAMMFYSRQWRLRDGKPVPFGDAPRWKRVL